MNRLNGKLLKIAGTLIASVCLIYVVRTVLQLDWRALREISAEKIVVAILITTITYTISFIAMAWAWKGLLEGTRNYTLRVPAGELIQLYTRANLGKYLPGNVGEFVFRNLLGVKYGFTHTQIATASIAELLLSMIVAALLGLPALYFLGLDVLSTFDSTTVLMVVCLAIVAAIALAFVRRNRLISFFKELNFKLILRSYLIAAGIFALVFANLAAMLLFYIYWVFDFPMTIPQAVLVGSALTLAWVLGTVTPGAPGGIGVKEAVALYLSKDMGFAAILASALVIHRLVCVLGDISAFLISKFYFNPAGESK